jgi:hypothetical protein
MKCSNPNCDRSIGLVAHRRGWFGKRLYCSKKCGDSFVVEGPSSLRPDGNPATYFEWLFWQPIETPQPAPIRMRAHYGELERHWIPASDPRGTMPPGTA